MREVINRSLMDQNPDSHGQFRGRGTAGRQLFPRDPWGAVHGQHLKFYDHWRHRLVLCRRRLLSSSLTQRRQNRADQSPVVSTVSSRPQGDRVPLVGSTVPEGGPEAWPAWPRSSGWRAGRSTVSGPWAAEWPARHCPAEGVPPLEGAPHQAQGGTRCPWASCRLGAGPCPG